MAPRFLGRVYNPTVGLMYAGGFQEAQKVTLVASIPLVVTFGCRVCVFPLAASRPSSELTAMKAMGLFDQQEPGSRGC